MSFAIIRDDRTQDTALALMASEMIIGNIKQNFNVQTFKEIITISDGASANFKNKSQFHEFKKSSIKRRRVFSATGHGKGSCDGIGGLVKHYASKHNLTNDNLIRNAQDFAFHVKPYTTAISVMVLPVAELVDFRAIKKIEWENANKIVGI